MFASNTSQVSGDAVFVEDVFQTYLYQGTDATLTITNGVDLSTYGGLVWVKNRSAGFNHNLQSTGVGFSNAITSSATTYASTTDAITGFNTTGFTLGSGATYGWTNNGGSNYVSWSFRKQPKFFDVVTWTGNGTAGRTISHNLGSVPGAIFVKRLANGYDWEVYHTSLGNTKSLVLNDIAAAATRSDWNSTTPTSTQFTVGNTAEVNASGGTYVAYLFAHNAGGFGLTGTDNVISCGSVSYSGATSVNLGYEPQWILWRKASGTDDWWMFDTMRGLVVDNGSGTGDKALYANLSNAETGTYGIDPTATGFNLSAGWSNGDYIYIAIRRGPMKVPTSGTSVFALDTLGGTAPNPPGFNAGFPVDLGFFKYKAGTADWSWGDRLRGAYELYSNSTSAEVARSDFKFDYQDGWLNSTGVSSAIQSYNFKRAPSFFDEVCYTGNGAGASQVNNHNLGVVPELIISKKRSASGGWVTWATGLSGSTYYLQLNATDGEYNGGATLFRSSTQYTWYWGDNVAGATYVTYLFASCPGVSKVGSYSGTGSTQTISCGFTGGARWVMVKRIDVDGYGWYVWDTARGMVSGTDPSLLLNSTAAEVNANSIYTTTGGFQIVSTAAGINASGGSYIFLAIS